MTIIHGGLDDPRVQALLERHAETARLATGAGCAHVLDLKSLRAAEVTFWSIWEDNDLLGVGALKRLTPVHGEIKSMHTAAARRRSGVAASMLRHIIHTAQSVGMTRISLETGSSDYFHPARALYLKHGFTECPPFGDYAEDPNSVFMTMDLEKRRAAT